MQIDKQPGGGLPFARVANDRGTPQTSPPPWPRAPALGPDNLFRTRSSPLMGHPGHVSPSGFTEGTGLLPRPKKHPQKKTNQIFKLTMLTLLLLLINFFYYYHNINKELGKFSKNQERGEECVVVN